MIKKYLTTPEEILALKNTGTVIYDKHCDKTYLRFIDGVLCQFGSKDNRLIRYNITLNINENHYILVEEPVKEADENDIGKLCYFWDNESRGCPSVAVLEEVFGVSAFKYKAKGFASWQHCCRLSPSEVAEITGYKVEE